MHSSHIYGGFGDGDGDDFESAIRRSSPPENEIPVPLDLQVEIHRTPDLAVVLVGGRAYSTGAELDFTVRWRPGSVSPDDVEARRFPAPFHHDLLVGLELPDGEVVSTAGQGPWAVAGAPSDGPVLVPLGSSSDETRVDQAVWLSPPPAPGRMVCVVAYPEIGLPEVQITTTAEFFGIRSRVQIRSIAGSVTRAQPCEAGKAGTLV